MNAAAAGPAELALFGDSLACEETRPLALDTRAPDARRLRAEAANGEALLHALAIVEDGVRPEEPDSTGDTTLHRLEAKLDLLTALVAAVVPAPHGLAPRALRWSARGACLRVDEPLAVGARGTLRVQPVDWLPSTLALPYEVLACEAGNDGQQAWLRFDPLSPPLEAALERHLFRVHRRAVAETRRR
jgi:hypothetical protein